MNARELEKTVYRIKPDLVILDADELIVLLVQAEVDPKRQGDTSEVISWLKAGNGAIPFVMYVDLENIQIFKWNTPNPTEPVCIFNTIEVLSPYNLKLPDRWLSWYDISKKIEFWLDDLRRHWRVENPPAKEQLAEISFLHLLKDSTVQPEVEIRLDSKLRYIVLRYFSPRHDDY